MRKRTLLIATIVLLLLLAACGGSNNASEPAANETMAEEAMADKTADEVMADEAMADETMSDPATAEHSETMSDESMADESMADEGMADEGSAMMDDSMAAAWQQLVLTNARTGETFTFADFAGKTVFVEPMATWCSNCRQQLGNVSTAKAQLNSDEVVFVALSVETNISDADLAQYADAAGFDWLFAVATPELLQALVGTFDRTITNPPSTPHFIIRPDGSTTALVTGIESPELLIEAINAARG
ncbi:MAG: TlpA family protein disulfide reductase [Anaerolineales bacterium]|nr:TlpA family protein disulfide reductase [Anaerolineales bacterium]